MVDEVFQDDDATCRGTAVSGCEQLVEAWQDRALHGGESATVQVEARHLLQDVLVGDEDRDVRAVGATCCRLDEVGEGRQPPPRHEEGTRVMPRADRAFNDVRGFGHVQTSFRFDLRTKFDVFEARVVLQARICCQIRAGELDNHVGPLRSLEGARDFARPGRAFEDEGRECLDQVGTRADHAQCVLGRRDATRADENLVVVKMTCHQ